MKHSLRLFIVLILLVMAGSVSSAFAQSTRFAFVNKERNLIYIHEGDQKDTLFLPIAASKFRAERIAVLGSTSDGKSLFIAGKIMFAAIGSGVQDSLVGFFRIPIPEHGKQLSMTQLLTEGKILREVNEEVTKILPLGVITPDNNHWYAIWGSSAPNNPSFTFYHGNFNESAKPDNSNVDTAIVTGQGAFEAGYHTSNVTCTEDGNMGMFVVVDQLLTDGLEKVKIVRWTPGSNPVFTDITSKFPSSVGSPDKAFAFAIRGIGPSSQAKMQMAVVTEPDNATITIYELQNLANPSFNNPKATISRSALPNGWDFFTGYTGNSGDVYSQAPQQGNGGDMMFNRDGSKVIFITRESPENELLRAESSAIFEYGLTSGQINLLYNDTKQQERQPIFVDGTGIIPEPEQIIEVTPASLDFGTVMVPNSKTMQFTITNVGTVEANITNVTLGPNADYKITADPAGGVAPYAFKLAPGGAGVFDVTFTPAAKGTSSSSFSVSWGTDKSVTRTITGAGDVQGGGSVARDYREVFTFSVAPNPVHGAAVISLKGVETSNASLELVDATGRSVWSAASKLNAGATSTFDLNAQNLAAGSYFLIVRANDVQAMSQVVITK
jgi:hypothetical protein